MWQTVRSHFHNTTDRWQAREREDDQASAGKIRFRGNFWVGRGIKEGRVAEKEQQDSENGIPEKEANFFYPKNFQRKAEEYCVSINNLVSFITTQVKVWCLNVRMWKITNKISLNVRQILIIH